MRGGSTGGRSGTAGSRRGGYRLRPRRCREPGRWRGTQARRGHGEPPRRRAGDEGRRAWAPARHCSLQQGAGEAARCPGASGPEGRRARAPLQGAGIWARASGARRLGAQRGRLGRTDEVAAARVREVNRTFFMGRCIFPLWAGPRYGERHTSPHWALRHCLSCSSPISCFVLSLGLRFSWAVHSNVGASSLFWLISISVGRLLPASGLRSSYATSVLYCCSLRRLPPVSFVSTGVAPSPPPRHLCLSFLGKFLFLFFSLFLFGGF